MISRAAANPLLMIRLPVSLTTNVAPLFVMSTISHFRALTAAGHAVQSFASAEEVLPLADAGIEADCLLIDVHLPGLSGIDLCRKLRARGVQLPVICMSSDHNDFLRTDALRSGAMAHLSKPFELEALVEVLDRALLCGRRA